MKPKQELQFIFFRQHLWKKTIRISFSACIVAAVVLYFPLSLPAGRYGKEVPMLKIVDEIVNLIRKNTGKPKGYTSPRIERAVKPLTELSGTLTSLPRGGYLADTAAGYIQFGSPPETIKDTVRLPGGVPDIFVLSNDMFDWIKGISIAEIEFPIYYNFFIKKKKTFIICSREQFSRMKRVLQEAVFGPQSFDISIDYDPLVDRKKIPDIQSEMNFFRNNLKFSDIHGRNEKFRQIIDEAQVISKSPSNVLLLGESGTGKDILAQAIHNASPRRRPLCRHQLRGHPPRSDCQ